MLKVMNFHFILTIFLQIKCSGSCNNINDPYAELCVTNVVKGMNIKVFDLIMKY